MSMRLQEMRVMQEMSPLLCTKARRDTAYSFLLKQNSNGLPLFPADELIFQGLRFDFRGM